MWPILLLPAASAWSLALLGVPEIGGGLAHPAEPGTLGLFHSPAAAWSERPELLADGALFVNRYAFTLEGQPEVVSPGATGVPALAASVPLGPVGLGVSVFAPYARGGDPYPEDGPQRYHTIEGSLLAAEADVSAAVHVETPARLTVGGGLKVVSLSQSSRRAFDTGALLHDLLGEEADVPLQDPFLQGTQQVGEGSDVALGFTAGVRVEADTRDATVTVAADYRSATRHTLDAAFVLVPSDALTAQLEGEVATRLVLPPAADLGARVAFGRSAILLDGGWIGWSSVATLESSLTDLAITSGDELMTTLLEGYGLTEAEYLDALSEVTTATGARDSYSLGAAAETDLGRGFGVRGGLAWSSAAIPDANVHPGNCDFMSFNPRLSGTWAPVDRLWLGLTGSVYLVPPRDIDASSLSLTNPLDSGLVYPSGAGTYRLFAARVGLTARLRL